jgi:hypothetical protein
LSSSRRSFYSDDFGYIVLAATAGELFEGVEVPRSLIEQFRQIRITQHGRLPVAMRNVGGGPPTAIISPKGSRRNKDRRIATVFTDAVDTLCEPAPKLKACAPTWKF